MTLAIVAEVAPLQANEDGVILVGRTRITLDTVVAVFNQGATAEEITHQYPSLNLADIYAPSILNTSQKWRLIYNNDSSDRKRFGK